MNTRDSIISAGEHIYAVRKLGDSYDAEQYLQAITEARDADAGQRYADAVLGPDVAELLRGVEEAGDDVVKAAERSLRSRGIDPAAATYEQYADALAEASS